MWPVKSDHGGLKPPVGFPLPAPKQKPSLGAFVVQHRAAATTILRPLLLPRIVRWIHVIDILRAYTMKLDEVSSLVQAK